MSLFTYVFIYHNHDGIVGGENGACTVVGENYTYLNLMYIRVFPIRVKTNSRWHA